MVVVVGKSCRVRVLKDLIFVFGIGLTTASIVTLFLFVGKSEVVIDFWENQKMKSLNLASCTTVFCHRF